jgi:hypothetical protein
MILALAEVVFSDRCATIAVVLEPKPENRSFGLEPREPGSLLPFFTRWRKAENAGQAG